MSTPGELTPRQIEVLRALCRWLDDHGYPPSVRELGGALGLTSTRTIHDHLDALEDKGYIRRHRDRSRAIEILSTAVTAEASHASHASHASDAPDAGEATDATPTPPPRGMRPRWTADLMTVPLLGTVAAGQPVLAEENREGELQLDATLVRDPRSFLLRVRGQSMIDAHICDGDLILVRPQAVARNGEIVVVMIENEVTLKRLYRREGYLELRPENPAMAAILVTPEMGEVRILGALAGVIRRY